jgi:outer membrane protein OmpA-like peptidoglycan-associated protein
MFKKTTLILTGLLLLTEAAFAFNTQALRISFPGSRGIHFIESKPKPLDTLTLGLGLNYAHQPFEFGQATGNTRVQGIVDHLFTFDFNGSYSFSDRFALGVNLPVHVTNNITSLANVAMESPMNLGDIMVTALYNVIVPEENSANAGLSVTPFVSFPSGRSSDFIGDTNVTGGFLLVGDIDIEGHYFGVNLGMRLRETEDFLNLSVASEMLYSFIYHHALVPSLNLDGFVEGQGSTVLKDIFSQEISSPFEARLGLTAAFLDDKQLKVTMAHGLGVGNGYNAPDYRMVIKVAYDHLLPRVKKVEVVKVVERIEKIEQALKELTIYYPTDGAQVDPFYDQKIAGIAKILKKNPGMGPLYIVGHTDKVGGHRYNQKLSERRAKQAHDSILEHGIDSTDIVWMGAGETDANVVGTSAANRAQNRRTLFTFIKPKQLTNAYKRYGKTNYDWKKYSTDSYTEVLKEQEKDNKVQQENKSTQTTKTKIIRQDDDEFKNYEELFDGDKKKKKKKKSKKKKSKKQDDSEDSAKVTEKTIYKDDYKF